MAPKEIVIRPARIEDGLVLVAIENVSFSSPNWDADSLLRYDCIVAEVEGRIAGFLAAREVALEEREILNLAVDPMFRRAGVGSALLKYELASGGTHFLEVRESNSIGQTLYRKFGFTEVGRRPNYYDRPVETAIVMRMK